MAGGCSLCGGTGVVRSKCIYCGGSGRQEYAGMYPMQRIAGKYRIMSYLFRKRVRN